MTVNFVNVVSERSVAFTLGSHHSGFQHIERVAGHRADTTSDAPGQELLENRSASCDFLDWLVQTYD